jgi:hypothetical protein
VRLPTTHVSPERRPRDDERPVTLGVTGRRDVA